MPRFGRGFPFPRHRTQAASAANVSLSRPITEFATAYDSVGLPASVRLSGNSGSYVSTPDSVANSIVGDIDVRVRVSLDAWAPASSEALVCKRDTTTTISYALTVASSGALQTVTSPDGTTGSALSSISTTGTGFVDGSTNWLRQTLQVNDGAGNRVYNYYTSTDYNPAVLGSGTWTNIGTTVTTAGATTIFDSSSVLEIGAEQLGTLIPSTGNVYRAQILSGIGGTLKVDFNPGDASGPTATSWVSSTTGETWTVNGDAQVIPGGGGRVVNRVRALTETATATDAAVRSAVPHPRAITELATATDSAARALVQARAVTESATATDSVGRAPAHPRAVTESATATDSVARALVFARAVTDSATAADAVARVAVRSRPVTDSATAADSVARAQTAARAVTETATASDAVTRAAVYARAVTDSATAADAVTRAQTKARAVTESATATDSVARLLVQARSVTDSATVSEAVSHGIVRAVTETATAADSLARALVQARAVSDTATAADAVTRTPTHPRAVSDSATTTDSVARVLAQSRAVTESATASDLVTTTGRRFRSVSESALATDAATFSRRLFRSLVEIATATDVAVGVFTPSSGIITVLLPFVSNLTTSTRSGNLRTGAGSTLTVPALVGHLRADETSSDLEVN